MDEAKWAELAGLMRKAEQSLIDDMQRAFGSRDEQWARISRLAGLDEDGNILPPRTSGHPVHQPY